jgi:hypothetical protein
MKKIALCVLALGVLAFTAAAADVTGKWSGKFAPIGPDGQEHDGSAFVILKQAGTQLTGTAGPDESDQWPMSNGKIQGNKITGEVKDPNGPTYKLDLVLDGEHIKGDITVVAPDGTTQKAKLDVTRVK